jgi:Fe-S cluster assembly ATPase SufC
MPLLRYIEIENFKTFGENVRIDLSHPAVLIGPNNAGKTSVIQALALWNHGIKVWHDKKGGSNAESRERKSAGINRLDIYEVPVPESRCFWHNAKVKRGGNKSIEMVINVGLEIDGACSDCRLVFTWRDDEVIYCCPSDETIKNEALLRAATGLSLNLLYPMSGMELEEPIVKEGWISVKMGQGQTAQVLRNLCLKVSESSRSDWDEIADLVNRLFSVELQSPAATARGTISLKYRQPGLEQDLDISLAGRGQLQTLLILAYLYSHKNSVLLIDEPDAHLEILRQKQMYQVLKDVAQKNNCQVVIVTHSEVILNDAVEHNLTMILNGESIDLADRQDIRVALQEISVDHYYRAKVHPRLFYVEGSTDLDILRRIAAKIKHEASTVLDGPINCFYTRHNEPQDTLDHRLGVIGGLYPENVERHFSAIKKCIPECKGLALLDRDQRNRQDVETADFAKVYWQHYEVENTFITPRALMAYLEDRVTTEATVFGPQVLSDFKEVLNQRLLIDVFNGDVDQLQQFEQASESLQKTILRNIKMSEFAEKAFRDLAARSHQPMMMRKSDFFKLVDFVDDSAFGADVTKKLDLLVKYLKLAAG